jgi:hypothetical protein
LVCKLFTGLFHLQLARLSRDHLKPVKSILQRIPSSTLKRSGTFRFPHVIHPQNYLHPQFFSHRNHTTSTTHSGRCSAHMPSCIFRGARACNAAWNVVDTTARSSTWLEPFRQSKCRIAVFTACPSHWSQYSSQVDTIVPLRKQLKDEAKAKRASSLADGPKPTLVHDTRLRDWELTVGIEIHAQLNTARKLFSSTIPPKMGHLKTNL